MAHTEKVKTPARGRPRNHRTHGAIIKAANDVLSEHGFAALSFEGLAARAGVSKTSIYRRWSSKGELLLDLYMSEVSDPPEVPGRPFPEALEEYLMLTVVRLETPWWSVAIRSLVAEAQSDEALAKLVRQKVVGPRRAAVRRLMTQAFERGELATAADLEVLLDMLFGAMWYRLLLSHAPFDRGFVSDLVDGFMDMAGAN